jgi:uncharacterized protein
MMKLLLVLGVLLVAYLLWRAGRMSGQDRHEHRGDAAAGKPQDMVRCPVCSVHLPRGDAVAGADGRLYCSQEHRLLSGD